MAKGSMREQMPVVAEWIDDLRSAFGADYIDSILRAGMRGKPVFYASENGHTVGTPVPVGVRVGTDARGRSYLLDSPAEVLPNELSKYEARMRREKLKGEH
ncbi:hypothetical protein INH39_02930 [Massilia violaceinigra]|uniref:Uncharacterized protein n=1 Tax=Massilia violaceinigra TaxID=2045208 RepID=A0ABY4AAW9_9BURK|nr:hypothetical protein [Massilia violaceinigra]UOD30716.1 hypothetical protein INH39_02930 [Massilia violaceinigra]